MVEIGRLLASYAQPGGTPALTLAAYLEQTADIPLPWLVAALGSFRLEVDRQYLPTPSEICSAVARRVSSVMQEARGQVVTSQQRLDVGRCLEIARTSAPQGPAALRIVALRNKSVHVPMLDSGRQAERGLRGENAGQAIAHALALSGVGKPYMAEHGKLWAAGEVVPGRDHMDPSHAMQGYTLALMMARGSQGHDPLPTNCRERDLERYDRAMTRLEDEGGDPSWWMARREGFYQQVRGRHG